MVIFGREKMVSFTHLDDIYNGRNNCQHKYKALGGKKIFFKKHLGCTFCINLCSRSSDSSLLPCPPPSIFLFFPSKSSVLFKAHSVFISVRESLLSL